MSNELKKNDRTPPPDPSSIGRGIETSLLGMVLTLLALAAAIGGFGISLATLHGIGMWALIALCVVVLIVSVVAMERVLAPGDHAIATYVQREGWRGAEPNKLVRDACRALAAINRPENASVTQYPRNFKLSTDVARPGGTGHVAVASAMTVRANQGGKEWTISTAMYVWIELPCALPALTILQALRGERGLRQTASTLESADFNRRYVVDRWRIDIPGGRPLDEAGSKRYISALITPQIMQTLLDADRAIGAVGLCGTLLGTSILTDRPHSAELALDAMFTIAAQIPRFVMDDYGVH